MNLYTDDLRFFPPHEPTFVPGLHAYARQLRVRPGQALQLCISGEGEVQSQIWKLGASTREGALVAELPRVQAKTQATGRGSYIHIQNGLDELVSGSIEVWFRTLADAERAGLISQSGLFEVALEAGNVPVVSFWNADARLLLRGQPLSLNEWHLLTARWDGESLELWIDGERLDDEPVSEKNASSQVTGPLRLGALGNAAGQASAFYTGDIWAPVIYERLLDEDGIRARYRSKADSPAAGALAAWKFDALDGAPYRDESLAGRHGQPVNYPIRLIPGPRRTNDSDWQTYDPSLDPDFGHAVRFMADAVVDCRWPVSLEWQAPDDLPTGQYACRVSNESGETREVYFLVVPRQPRAKMLCLSTTNTRVAYNFAAFGDNALDYGAYARHPKAALLGHLLGARRPNTGEPWERQTIDFELPFYAWLDRENIPYDLYAEWDLEENPGLLDGYETVAWAGHSEYWTVRQYEALQAFNARGGHLLAFSGNTAYWRVSADLENAVIEVRKHAREPMDGTDFSPLLNSAHHHQMDGLPGGVMREAGWPEHLLLGTATTGSTNPPLDGPHASYEVLEPGHELFHRPRPIETAFPFAPDAAAYECDLSVRSHIRIFGPSTSPHYPAHDGKPWPLTPEEATPGLVILAYTAIPDSNVLDYTNQYFKGEMGSEILLWQRPGHGLIFSVGSVMCGDVLLIDKNFSDFALNALNLAGIETDASA